MNTKSILLLKSVAMVIGVAAGFVYADGIPQPDVIVWGTVTINGSQSSVTDDVKVIGRADGIANPVGMYRMGELDAANDRYFLQIRLETVVAGATPTNAAVQYTPGGASQTVRLFVKEGEGPEMEVPPVLTVNAQGAVINRDLSIGMAPTSGDCDGDGDVDLVDFGQFQLCFTGGTPVVPGCECADLDGDNDADLVDFGAFQLAFTG
jgi:hypothetical protein